MLNGVRPPCFQRSMSLTASKSEYFLPHFSDIQANSYSSWIFSFLKHFDNVISPFDKTLVILLKRPRFQCNFIWVNGTQKT